jgi:hypothetical protein
LQVVVEGFHGLVVEGVFCALCFLRPEQGFVGVGEAHAAKVGHRVVFDPDHIVENPKAEVLQDSPHAIDIVIRADDPQRAGVFQHPAAGREPGAGEGVVFGETAELVPGVVDRVDLALVGAVQVVLQLQVVGRVGKNQIDRGFGQLGENFDAVARQDGVKEQGHASQPF